jgi:hypothetical protein
MTSCPRSSASRAIASAYLGRGAGGRCPRSHSRALPSRPMGFELCSAEQFSGGHGARSAQSIRPQPRSRGCSEALRSRTPGASPFVNSTPAASSASRIAISVRGFSVSPRSRRVRVADHHRAPRKAMCPGSGPDRVPNLCWSSTRSGCRPRPAGSGAVRQPRPWLRARGRTAARSGRVSSLVSAMDICLPSVGTVRLGRPRRIVGCGHAGSHV